MELEGLLEVVRRSSQQNGSLLAMAGSAPRTRHTRKKRETFPFIRRSCSKVVVGLGTRIPPVGCGPFCWYFWSHLVSRRRSLSRSLLPCILHPSSTFYAPRAPSKRRSFPRCLSWGSNRPEHPHVFDRCGLIGKNSRLVNLHVLEWRGPIGKDLSHAASFWRGWPIGKDN